VVAESVLDSLVEAISEQSAEMALSCAPADWRRAKFAALLPRSDRHFRNLLWRGVRCGLRAGGGAEDERPRLAEQAARFSEKI